MAFTERFDHVAVAVEDGEKAAGLFRDALGGELVGGMDVPEEGFRFTQYRYPNRMKVEFLGLDIDARLASLRARGFEPVHVVDQGSWREAFIHPRQAHGVLVQLLEMIESPPNRR